MAIKDLFKPRWKHSNPIVRKAAIEKISDQNILSEVATNDENHSVRLTATEKLTNQQVIADIARNDKNEAVRKTALEILTDQKIIIDIAQNDENLEVKIKAIKKIEDRNLLADFSSNNSNPTIRKEAVQNLKNVLVKQLIDCNFEVFDFVQQFIDNSFPSHIDINNNFFFHSFYHSYNESEEPLAFSDFPKFASAIRNHNQEKKFEAAMEVIKTNPTFDIAYFHAANAVLSDEIKAKNLIQTGLEKSNKKANLFELLGDIERQEKNYLYACFWYIRSCFNQYKIQCRLVKDFS